MGNDVPCDLKSTTSKSILVGGDDCKVEFGLVGGLPRPTLFRVAIHKVPSGPSARSHVPDSGEKGRSGRVAVSGRSRPLRSVHVIFGGV